MLQLSDLNLRPNHRILRQFAAAWLVFFGGSGAWKIFQRGPSTANIAMLAAGIVIGCLGLVAPQAIRLLYAGATLLAFPVGWVVSRVLLAVLYYGMMTPIGLAMRLAKRDRLRLRLPAGPGSETHWTPRAQSGDMSRYLRQF